MTTMTHLSLWRWLSCHRPQHTRPQPLRSDRALAAADAGERQDLSNVPWLDRDEAHEREQR